MRLLLVLPPAGTAVDMVTMTSQAHMRECMWLFARIVVMEVKALFIKQKHTAFI